MAPERNESLQSCRLTAPSALNHNRTFKLECYWNAKSNADTNTKLTVLCPKTARNQTKEFISSTKRICEGHFTLGPVTVPVWKFRKEKKTLAFFYFKKQGGNKNLWIQLSFSASGSLYQVITNLYISGYSNTCGLI